MVDQELLDRAIVYARLADVISPFMIASHFKIEYDVATQIINAMVEKKVLIANTTYDVVPKALAEEMGVSYYEVGNEDR